MRRLILLFLLFPCFLSQGQPVIVDHHSVALFDSIPPTYRDAARNLRMIYLDRSVGSNINDGLNCLSVSHAAAPSYCKRYQHGGIPSFPVDPTEVFWNGTWNRSNWRFEGWPPNCNLWTGGVSCFIQSIEPRIDSFDVASYQFSYLEVNSGSSIADPVNGFFGIRSDRGTATDYAAFAARHPDKTLIWWTTSLARGIGTEESRDFNDAMRQYCVANNLVLFDVADILSHDPAGNPCYDNRDGQPYTFGSNSENHPDDGQDIPAICPQYTTEVEGGHLGSISAGMIRVSKAFWVLMARIAGWDGAGTGDTTKPPEKVMLLSPRNNTEIASDTVSFQWRSSSPAVDAYVLDVANDNSFRVTVFSDSTLSDTSASLQRLARGLRYYWRVRAKNSMGWGEYSDTYSFNLAPATLFSATPITEMGRSLYKGFGGGLYPDGTNERPATHDSTGRALAHAIVPLDTAGQTDHLNGRIVLLSIGMSNTSQEFSFFESMVDTFRAKNPFLVAVNGAQGGQTASIIRNPDAQFWQIIEKDRLPRKNVTREQIQVVWLKEANASPSQAFPRHAEMLEEDIRGIVRLLPQKYPNIKLAYLSSRIYGGYAIGPLNPEPYAYESGFTIKWIVGDQINGDTALAFDVSRRNAPWLSWGPYLWANGSTSRQDGLVWLREDLAQDGTHPSNLGREKVARLLLDFFRTDETTRPWFLAKTSSRVVQSPDPAEARFSVIPHPLRDDAIITFSTARDVSVRIELTDILGRRLLTIFEGSSSSEPRSIPFSIARLRMRPGIYLLRMVTPIGITVRKVMLVQ